MRWHDWLNPITYLLLALGWTSSRASAYFDRIAAYCARKGW